MVHDSMWGDEWKFAKGRVEWVYLDRTIKGLKVSANFVYLFEEPTSV